MKKIIIALPAYNEEKSISALLDEFESSLSSYKHACEYVIVNDGSTDGTLDAIKPHLNTLKIHIENHEKNKGLGEAIKTGLKKAISLCESDADIIVNMDADNTHHPKYIIPMIEKVAEGADIVIASRYREGSVEIGVPFLRKVYSRAAKLIFTITLRLPNVRDYTCGYRAYRAGLIRSALETYGDSIIERQGFACTDELLVNLSALTDKIYEIPFVLNYDLKKGKSKLNLFLTIIETLKMILKSKKSRRRKK